MKKKIIEKETKSDKKMNNEESNNIINEILDSYKEEKNDWKYINKTVLYKAFNNFKGKNKVLGLDIDGTLIEFDKKNNLEYKLMFKADIMQKKIQEYIQKDYAIVLFSNQKGIIKKYIKQEDLTLKLDKLVNEVLNYPLLILCATDDDYYRKPSIGMIDLYIKNYNNNEEVNKGESLYVGDAAGRLKTKSFNKKDYSNSDYKFAINIGFKFKTPEEFFLDQKSEFPEIKNFLIDLKNNKNDHIKFENADKQEVILLIGPPGSGKSTYTMEYLVPKNYIRINQDDLRNKNNVKNAIESNLKGDKKNNIVIDCTNPTKSSRKYYIDLCKEINKDIKIRAFNFLVDKNLAFHLNNLRKINNFRKHYSEAVPDIPIHSFFKNYEKPDIKEGFDEVVNVNFIPGPFSNKEDENIFYCLS